MNYDGSIVAIGVPYNDDNGQWNVKLVFLKFQWFLGAKRRKYKWWRKSSLKSSLS